MFIKLTDKLDKTTVYMNMNLVAAMRPDNESTTMFLIGSTGMLKTLVSESVETILKLTKDCSYHATCEEYVDEIE